jgi:ribosome maturation factor RimP
MYWNANMHDQRLADLLGPTIEALGYELVCIELVRAKSATVRIFIDKEGGVNLSDCERVSTQVSGVLDVEDPIADNYSLEVSSPGLDRPLVSIEHFQKYLGKPVKVQLERAVEGMRKFSGVISQVEDRVITFDVDGNAIEVSFDQIARARLVPQFDKP